MLNLLRVIKENLPWIVIGGAFLWAATTVFLRHEAQPPPGVITLRIAHWNLEPGVHDAIDDAAREYQKLHPNVRVIQEAIPDSSWAQWLTTQLMGTDPPDIAAAGNIEQSLLTSLFLRHFLPLTSYVMQPDPYNRGTDQEKVPLFLTYKDHLRTGYAWDVHEFMSLPTALFTSRLFYNRDLLKKLTGLDQPPTELRAFLRVCDQIRAQKDLHGKPYTPIAGSGYTFGLIDGTYCVPLTYPALFNVDIGFDGWAQKQEIYLALKTGHLTLNDPAYRARLELVRDMTHQFQPGFAGLTRDDAVMLFARQNAVMTATGSWDVRGLWTQAKASGFQVGVMRFPEPLPDDPEFGPYYFGIPYEFASQAATPFAVIRESRHVDVAIDFLLFLASQKENERFNTFTGWTPAIEGAKSDPSLKDFEPNLYGPVGAFDMAIGGETDIKWRQLYGLYIAGQIDIDHLNAQMTDFINHDSSRDWDEYMRNRQREALQAEQMRVALRARMMGPGATPMDQIRYRVQLGFRESGAEHQFDLIVHGKQPPPPVPYLLTPEVIERARKQWQSLHPVVPTSAPIPTTIAQPGVAK
jgi:raffinose/stachyose/melibiose transport system substrate-binding protein